MAARAWPQDTSIAVDRGGNDPNGIPGMGVGLSIVAQFASVHGGRAWVEDSPHGGASFRVLLPGCVVH